LPTALSQPLPSDGLTATARSALPPDFCQFDALLPAMQLRAFSAPVNSEARLDPSSAQLMFHQSLAQAQCRVLNVWEASTIQRRSKAMQELDTWLQQLPAAWGKTLMTCTPADLVVYLESHWLSQHAGTTLPNGCTIASPSGVNQCLSSCSTGFELLGRVGDWNPLDSSGNPVDSSLVAQYRKGYRLEAWRSGYLEGSAVPMQAEKLYLLVDYLDHLVSGLPAGMPQLLLERDIVLILLMWETPMRGNNCGRLTWSDFFLTTGQQAPYPLLGAAAGTALLVQPNGTKTVKGERSGPFTLTLTDDPQHSCLARLLKFLQLRYPDGHLSDTYLFSPQTANQRAFHDVPLSSSALGKRLQKHLCDAELYAGESNHGFRRGQIQSMVASGMDRPAISQATQIKTLSVIDIYADLTRHIPRFERLQKRAASEL